MNAVPPRRDVEAAVDFTVSFNLSPFLPVDLSSWNVTGAVVLVVMTSTFHGLKLSEKRQRPRVYLSMPTNHGPRHIIATLFLHCIDWALN